MTYGVGVPVKAREAQHAEHLVTDGEAVDVRGDRRDHPRDVCLADALFEWLRECVACAHEYRGVTSLMMAAIVDPESALHSSCITMRAAGTRLLARAQDIGIARTDIDGNDLFSLVVGALAWLSDQITSAILSHGRTPAE